MYLVDYTALDAGAASAADGGVLKVLAHIVLLRDSGVLLVDELFDMLDFLFNQSVLFPQRRKHVYLLVRRPFDSLDTLRSKPFLLLEIVSETHFIDLVHSRRLDGVDLGLRVPV